MVLLAAWQLHKQGCPTITSKTFNPACKVHIKLSTKTRPEIEDRDAVDEHMKSKQASSFEKSGSRPLLKITDELAQKQNLCLIRRLSLHPIS